MALVVFLLRRRVPALFPARALFFAAGFAGASAAALRAAWLGAVDLRQQVRRISARYVWF